MGKSLRRRKRSSNKTLRRRKRSTNKTLRRKNIYKGGMRAAGGDNPQTVNFDQLEGKIKDYEVELGPEIYEEIKRTITTLYDCRPKFVCYNSECSDKGKTSNSVKSRIKKCCEASKLGSFSYYTDMFVKCTNCKGYSQEKFTEHGGDPDIRRLVAAKTIENYIRQTDMKVFLNNIKIKHNGLYDKIISNLGLHVSVPLKRDLTNVKSFKTLKKEKRESAAREAAAAEEASLLREKELKAQLNVQVGTPNELEGIQKERSELNSALEAKLEKRAQARREFEEMKKATQTQKGKDKSQQLRSQSSPPSTANKKSSEDVKRELGQSLIEAVKEGNQKKVRSLLAKGADVNFIDKGTPLHWAVIRFKTGIVKLLLDKGADPNIKDYQGNPLLHISLSQKKVDVNIIRHLLDKGADPNIIDLRGYTPLYLALMSPHVDLKIIRLLLDNDADPNIKNFEGNCLLHMALVSKNVDFNRIRLLLEKGADPNIKDSKGYPPLYVALMSPHFDLNIIRLLLDNGADVNAVQERTNYTPLHFEIIKANEDEIRIPVVKLLLEKSADINKENKNGITPKGYLELKLEELKLEKLKLESDPSKGMIFELINKLFEESTQQ